MFKAYLQQEIADAKADDDLVMADKLQQKLDNLETDLIQLSESPLPDVECRTCNAHPKVSIGSGRTCAGCGGNLTTNAQPSNPPNLYPRDEETDIPMTLGGAVA